MKESDNLFQLIQSLDANERGYVIKISKVFGNESSNHIRLFKYLCNIKSYNEELVQEEFAGETFLNQLHRIKNYLYHFVVDVLVFYERNKLKETNALHYLTRARILQKKKMVKLAENELAKGIEIALTNEQLIEDLILQNELNGILSRHYNWNDISKSTSNFNLIIEKTEKVSTNVAYNFLYYRFYILLSQNKKIKNFQNDTLDNLYSQLISKVDKATSFQKLLFHSASMFYTIIKNDAINTTFHAKKCVSLLEKKEKYATRNAYKMIVAYMNYIFLASNIEQVKEAKYCLLKLKKYVKKDWHDLLTQTNGHPELYLQLATIYFNYRTNKSPDLKSLYDDLTGMELLFNSMSLFLKQNYILIKIELLFLMNDHKTLIKEFNSILFSKSTIGLDKDIKIEIFFVYLLTIFNHKDDDFFEKKKEEFISVLGNSKAFLYEFYRNTVKKLAQIKLLQITKAYISLRQLEQEIKENYTIDKPLRSFATRFDLIIDQFIKVFIEKNKL